MSYMSELYRQQEERKEEVLELLREKLDKAIEEKKNGKH